jgi:hypothetical protein
MNMLLYLTYDSLHVIKLTYFYFMFLGKEMKSKEAKNDLELLLHMEIKLRLLEIEGIPELPQEPPPIPELPPDFDFASLQQQFAGTKYVVFN